MAPVGALNRSAEKGLDLRRRSWLQFQPVSGRLDDRRRRVVAVRVWVRRFPDVLEVHSKPHDRFLEFRHGQRAFTASPWVILTGEAFALGIATTLDLLQDFIEILAPLFCVRRSGFGWCHFRLWFPPLTPSRTRRGWQRREVLFRWRRP